MDIAKVFWFLFVVVPGILGMAAAYGIYRYARWEQWCLGRAVHEYRNRERSVESLTRIANDLLWRTLKYGFVATIGVLFIHRYGGETGHLFSDGLMLSLGCGMTGLILNDFYRRFCV